MVADDSNEIGDPVAPLVEAVGVGARRQRRSVGEQQLVAHVVSVVLDRGDLGVVPGESSTCSGRTSTAMSSPTATEDASTAIGPSAVWTSSASPLSAAADEVRLADEAGDPACRRCSVELVGRADLLDPTLPHHRDLVAEDERLVLIVGDEHRGDADVAEDSGDLGADVDAQAGVERRERFVEEENRRIGGERSGERDALLLAAGQGVGQSVAEPDEVDQLEQFVDSAPPARTGSACCISERRPNAMLSATVRCGNSAPS